jgi:hypothetical protein
MLIMTIPADWFRREIQYSISFKFSNFYFFVLWVLSREYKTLCSYPKQLELSNYDYNSL